MERARHVYMGDGWWGGGEHRLGAVVGSGWDESSDGLGGSEEYVSQSWLGMQSPELQSAWEAAQGNVWCEACEKLCSPGGRGWGGGRLTKL